MTPQNRAGIEDAMAAGFRVISKNGAEFLKSGIHLFSIHHDFHIAFRDFQVGKCHSRAQMALISEDGIADISKVRRPGFIEKNAVFELATVPKHASVAGDDVSAQISAMTHLAILPNPGGSLDINVRFHDGAFIDENGPLNHGVRRNFAEDIGLQVLLKISANAWKRFPRMFATLEDGWVVGLAQVQQI